MNALALILTTFLASAVEAVEALTIVLAAGVTREWRSTLIGAGTAFGALAVLVAALGPALTVIPIGGLRLIVGGLLLTFGLQWLRKAILRASGLKPLHDEDAIFRQQTAAAQAAGEAQPGAMDWYAFTLAFKGVLLEGLEVVFIVLSFGANAHNLLGAAAGAGAAVVAAVVAGACLRHPLARVPENAMKFVVGLMLITFGTFWGGEGAGVRWPGSDLALLALLVTYTLAAGASVMVLRRLPSDAVTPAGSGQ